MDSAVIVLRDRGSVFVAGKVVVERLRAGLLEVVAEEPRSEVAEAALFQGAESEAPGGVIKGWGARSVGAGYLGRFGGSSGLGQEVGALVGVVVAGDDRFPASPSGGHRLAPGAESRARLAVEYQFAAGHHRGHGGHCVGNLLGKLLVAEHRSPVAADRHFRGV